MLKAFLPFLLIGFIYSDELTCNTLRALNTVRVDFASGVCACTDGVDTTSDSCTGCFSGGSFKGIAESSSVKNLTGTTFSQQTDVEICFQYEDDTYGGAKVCYSYKLFGSNPDTQCTVTVDGASCAACQTFTQASLAFDCSNIGYVNATGGNAVFEVRQDAPVADAIDGSLLRFMADMSSAEGCQTGGGGSGGYGSGATNSAVFHGMLVTTLVATIFESLVS